MNVFGLVVTNCGTFFTSQSFNRSQAFLIEWTQTKVDRSPFQIKWLGIFINFNVPAVSCSYCSYLPHDKSRTVGIIQETSCRSRYLKSLILHRIKLSHYKCLCLGLWRIVAKIPCKYFSIRQYLPLA